LPTLTNYSSELPDCFWDNFPFSPVPRGVTKRVNEEQLREIIHSVSSCLTSHQIKRGEKLLRDLTLGADSYQVRQLPPVKVPNAASAEEHGEMLSDKLATWVSTGIARGPFKQPPFLAFRANSLMAIE
jgi:hypothetical protein